MGDATELKRLVMWTDGIQTLLANDGFVSSKSLYANFWKMIHTNAEYPSVFIVTLLLKLYAFETGDESRTTAELLKRLKNGDLSSAALEKGFQPDVTNVGVRHALLTTIYFVALFFTFEDTILLQKAVSIFKGSSKAKSVMDDTLRLLGKKNREAELYTFIEAVSNVECHTGQATRVPELPSVSDSREAVPAMLYLYLKDLVRRGGKDSAMVFTSLNTFLKHPSLKEGRVISLMFMIRSFLTTNPRVDETILKGYNKMLRQYYHWPNPYGQNTKDTMKLLTYEARAPGVAYRAVIYEEYPELRGDRPTGTERLVHLFINTSSRYGEFVQDVLVSPGEEPSPMSIKTAMLQTRISAALGQHVDLSLEVCAPDKLDKFIRKADDIMKVSLELSEDKAKESRIRGFDALRRDVLSHTKTQKKGRTPPMSGVGGPGPLQMNMVAMKQEESLQHVDVGQGKYAAPACMKVLQSMLQNASDKKSKPVVKIGIVGGDAAVHNVAAAYCALKHLNPGLFDGVTPQFYIIPMGTRNNFARFLAAYDGWYGRQVLVAQRVAMTIFPHFVTVRDKQKGHKSPSPQNGIVEEVYKKMPRTKEPCTSVFPSPGVFLRETWSNYFRDARNIIPVQLYEAVCWEGGNSITRIIPFVQRLEVGLGVEAKKYLSGKGIDSNNPLTDIKPHLKSIKFQYMGLNVNATQMNIFGFPRKATIEAKAFRQISIANVPSIDDCGVPANPIVPWLEVYTVEPEQNKKKKNKESEHTYHANMIEMESDTKFQVLIDGELYGPFSKVKVVASNVVGHGNTTEAITLPVMNFLPLDI